MEKVYKANDGYAYTSAMEAIEADSFIELQKILTPEDSNTVVEILGKTIPFQKQFVDIVEGYYQAIQLHKSELVQKSEELSIRIPPTPRRISSKTYLNIAKQMMAKTGKSSFTARELSDLTNRKSVYFAVDRLLKSGELELLPTDTKVNYYVLADKSK